MRVRQLLALAVGTVSGYVLGKWSGLDIFSVSVTSNGVFLQREIVLFFILAVLAGTVTPLVSWKHTPGLPAMVFSLVIALLGLSAVSPLYTGSIGESEVLLSYVFDSILIIAALLVTYSLAWFTDTRVVFRALPVKPQPKDTDGRTVLLRMMPCCLLNAVGGAVTGFIMPLSGAISIFISFALISFLSSHLFKVRSTLWYSVSVPLYLAMAGAFVLSQPELGISLFPSSWLQGYPSFLICGTGSAGALLGNRLWMISIR
jgi:hypothetical protein